MEKIALKQDTVKPKVLTKTSSLESIYNDAFEDELKKIAQYEEEYKQPYQYKAWHTIPAGAGIAGAYAAGTAVAAAPGVIRAGMSQRNFLKSRHSQAYSDMRKLPTMKERLDVRKKLLQSTPSGKRLANVTYPVTKRLGSHLRMARNLGVATAISGPALWGVNKFLGRRQARAQQEQQQY